MKRTKRTLTAIVAMMALVCMMLAGCGAKSAPADQSVNALFELYAKNNAAPMQELLGFESVEAVNAAFVEEDAEVDVLAEMTSIIEDADVEMTEEEIQSFTDSLMGMVNKASATAEITSEDGDYTTVTLQVYGFSSEEMMTIITDCATAMTESITEEDAIAIGEGDMEVYNKYMKQYITDFVNGMAAMDPVAEPVEVVVECEKQLVEVNGKEQAEWMPVDMDGFCADVDAAMFQE
ncbi:MAG: hypothetical protein IJD96_05450 [Lachnospiraceae bacterium]|nr:hypothetical protein [Lachnospiraceae bacterium]